MPKIVIKLPDIGEGIAEAEIAEWDVAVGDMVQEDDPLGTVMTDKAAVEIPSSLTGTVVWIAGEPGEMLPVGAPYVTIDTGEAETAEVVDTPQGEEIATEPVGEVLPVAEDSGATSGTPPPAPDRGKALAAPAVRARARALGIDLAGIDGSGPGGRVLHADLDACLMEQAAQPPRHDGITEIRIIGLRRQIAEQMARAHSRVPQITIVEETDVTELERLRAQMNEERGETQPRLTLLPFLVRAMDRARVVAPQVNGRYDDEAGIHRQYEALHLGIATQTERGLMVPVLRHADALSVWQLAQGIAAVADMARAGTASREDLGGSTMTITSLGSLGALATTPIVNQPEVAILGVNRIQTRPVWDGQAFVPRRMMNLSASFDHRIVDGWDAARFVDRLKRLIETPARLFT